MKTLPGAFPHSVNPLYRLKDLLLELALNLLASIIGARLSVEGHKGAKVELGLLEELDLADVDLFFVCQSPEFPTNGRAKTYVLEGVDALGGLLDLAANDLGDQLGGELGKGAAGSLALDDLGHLFADGADLGRSGIGSLLDLVGAALGESDGEEADEVVVGGLDRDVGLDQGLPLADERAELVGGEVETVEVGQAVLALDLVDAELDLAERVVLILLEIGERNLDDTSLQGIVGVLETGGPVDQGLADTEYGVRYLLFFFAGIESRSGYSRGGSWAKILLSDVERRGGLENRRNHGQRFVKISPDYQNRRTLMPYQSLRAKGSTVFFLRPFLPLDNLLFLSLRLATVLKTKIHRRVLGASGRNKISCNRYFRIWGGRHTFQQPS